MNLELAIQQLEQNRYFVWDDFLSNTELNLVREDFRIHYAEGDFKRAGIGKGADHQLNDEVRRDETYWCEPIFQYKLDELKHAINEAFYLGLWEFEGHYAYYPVGGIYKAHIDRFNHDDARTISMVLYLNEDWKEGDGGELRIHHDYEKIDVLPIGGRLVCFMSSEILHEVLPAKKPRKSYAGWWKRR